MKHWLQERSSRPQSTLAGGMDDISSPDLGVDLGSDPFSSLERTGKKTYQTISRECVFLKRVNKLSNCYMKTLYLYCSRHSCSSQFAGRGKSQIKVRQWKANVQIDSK